MPAGKQEGGQASGRLLSLCYSQCTACTGEAEPSQARADQCNDSCHALENQFTGNGDTVLIIGCQWSQELI